MLDEWIEFGILAPDLIDNGLKHGVVTGFLASSSKGVVKFCDNNGPVFERC
jgi:hypothetical protein